jgi:multidrug efflux pump subunit AcrA (membrane-fusion protein)
MTCAKVVACLAVMALLGGIVFTQEVVKEGKTGKPTAEAKPATHKIEKKPFKIELTVKGILQAEETAEISYRPHPMVQPPASHGSLTIRKIVDHGAKVKKGELLVAFDTSKIDDVIEDLVKELKALEPNIRLAEAELPLLEKSMPFELGAAETAKKRADQELKYFLDVGRAQTEKQVNMFVKTAKFYMEYAQEELRQLEKMYKANDLTEDTEQIILRRQRNWVETATFWYQSALLERDYVLKFSLPNQEKTLKETQARLELQLEKARKTLEPMAIQKQAALAKMRFDHDKNVARLEKLVKDRAAMTIQSPIEGVVFHGKFHHGHWTASDALENRLAPNGTVSPDEVFLTVVKPRPVVVHLTIEEKDVHLLKPGSEGKAKLLFDPERKLPARVTKVASVPASPGKFDAQVVLEMGAGDAKLMPGMACSVKFVPYFKKEAIAVPSTAVHEEDDKHVVYVVGKKGKQEKRDVTPGRSDGEHTEILAGLQEGEEILMERPSQKAPEKKPAPGPDKEKGAVP